MTNGGRIGVYVDGYNLYYGARSLCGRGADSWKWIDVRALVTRVVAGQRAYAKAQGFTGSLSAWEGATIGRIVYCTARIDANLNPEGHTEQDVYLQALQASRSVDWIEHGYYVTRTKSAPLAVRVAGATQPQIVTSNWPIMVQDATRTPVPDATFIVSYLHTEEKGSDVNVGSHLLSDVFQHACDAAVVVSNDSDLRLPVQMARKLVPVGVVSPRSGLAHGALRHHESLATTNHWNRNIRAADILASQLPPVVGQLTRPAKW